MMVYFSLNKKEALPEVTHEKYREEAEFVMNKRGKEEVRTRAKENNRKNRKENRARTWKTRRMTMTAISEVLIRYDVITN